MYLYQQEDGSWTIFYDSTYIPETFKNKIITTNIPEYPQDGNGYVLSRNPVTEEFYWELVTSEEPELEPEPEPIPPVETIEEKINKLSTITEQNNLITVDAVLGVYEELIALREEVAALKGTSNNA